MKPVGAANADREAWWRAGRESRGEWVERRGEERIEGGGRAERCLITTTTGTGEEVSSWAGLGSRWWPWHAAMWGSSRGQWDMLTDPAGSLRPVCFAAQRAGEEPICTYV